jgi:hypothetical protein
MGTGALITTDHLQAKSRSCDKAGLIYYAIAVIIYCIIRDLLHSRVHIGICIITVAGLSPSVAIIINLGRVLPCQAVVCAVRDSVQVAVLLCTKNIVVGLLDTRFICTHSDAKIAVLPPKLTPAVTADPVSFVIIPSDKDHIMRFDLLIQYMVINAASIE